MFDIAIIGAGLAGAATAVLLAKRDPNLRIALLEKRNEEDIINEVCINAL
jgi:L-2-hydroxyglutarate oxidase LhgO